MEPIRILFLAANPKDTSQLRLSEEVRTIDEKLRTAKFRERFQLLQFWAVRPGDIIEALLRHQPHIVHFSGHGSDLGEIILEDNEGMSKPALVAILSDLFRTLTDKVRCVVLNACYSHGQAKAIVQHIDCVVGMSREIDDKCAIAFASGFYRALGYGRSIRTAFDIGCIEADFIDSDTINNPVLLEQVELIASNLYFMKDIITERDEYEETTFVSSSSSKNDSPIELKSFIVETLKDRQLVTRDDLPLNIEGHYTIDGAYSSGHLGVWVVLQDDHGHFYLQNPEVTFFPGGKWIAMNILPGIGIEFVHFAKVNINGNEHFKTKVDRRDYGAFDKLPEGTVILVSIRIVSRD